MSIEFLDCLKREGDIEKWDSGVLPPQFLSLRGITSLCKVVSVDIFFWSD